MEEFKTAFLDGIGHIFCLDAIDHILYLLVLVACFSLSNLKNIFWLVTAFTLGHAATYILASLDILQSASWSEKVIPLTIMVTAILNFTNNKNNKGSLFIKFSYVVALGFGAIHGMAIGSMLRIKLNRGESLVTQMIGYNLGVELAQVIVVLFILFIHIILMKAFNFSQSNWRIGASALGLGAALVLFLDKF